MKTSKPSIAQSIQADQEPRRFRELRELLSKSASPRGFKKALTTPHAAGGDPNRGDEPGFGDETVDPVEFPLAPDHRPPAGSNRKVNDGSRYRRSDSEAKTNAIPNLDFLDDPPPNNGILVIAMAGARDVLMAASAAAERVTLAMDGRVLARTVLDRFHLYHDGMPQLTWKENNHAVTTWPSLELYVPGEKFQPGPLILVGPRPTVNLKAFADTVARICRELGITSLVHLQATVGNCSHNRPVPVAAEGVSPEYGGEVNDRLRRMRASAQPSGPAAVSQDGAVLHSAISAGIPLLSIGAVSPAYFQFCPDLRVAYRLATVIRDVAGLPADLDLSELAGQAASYAGNLALLESRDPMIQAMARSVEEDMDRREAQAEESSAAPVTGLEPGDEQAMTDDIEAFLRNQREAEGG